MCFQAKWADNDLSAHEQTQISVFTHRRQWFIIICHIINDVSDFFPSLLVIICIIRYSQFVNGLNYHCDNTCVIRRFFSPNLAGSRFTDSVNFLHHRSSIYIYIIIWSYYSYCRGKIHVFKCQRGFFLITLRLRFRSSRIVWIFDKEHE